MPSINVNNVKELVNNKSFEEVKPLLKELGIKLRYSGDLYLLFTDNDDTPLDLECNGLILEKDTNKIVCSVQNKFKNINQENPKKQIDELIDTYKHFDIEYCQDATRISLYNYNSVWCTSTSKKIDAKYSYWSDKSFDELFWETFDERDLDSHDKDFTYTYLLKHIDNRIVVRHTQNSLEYIGRINNHTQHYDDNTVKLDNSTVLYPLDDNYFSDDTRGLVFRFYSNDSVFNYKYDFIDYSKLKDIRGNVPSIRMRYLELLSQPDKMNLLYCFYNEHSFLFQSIQHQISRLYYNIHALYIESHVKHTIVVYEHHPFFKTLRQLHGHYKNYNTPITMDIVIDKVSSLDKMVIKNLLNWV